MLEISRINNISNINNLSLPKKANVNNNAVVSLPLNLKRVDSETIKAYHSNFNTSFGKDKIVSKHKQMSAVMKKLDKNTASLLKDLDKNVILDDKNSNDGTSVLENLYKIAQQPRINGLNESVILSEVINAISNPESITQTFGDIPENTIPAIEQATGSALPENAKNVASSCCVVASIEYNLASKKPAEFVRLVQGLSSQNYSVSKKVKLSDIDSSPSTAIKKLREFNAENKISAWDNVEINIKPDRNAIIRARVQQSYKDPGERSCIDVLVQSALLNLGSQNSYDTLTDIRTGQLNSDNKGLNDYEKNFVENIIFEKPKISIVYQNLDVNGKLIGYNCPNNVLKNHLLNSLNMGENVIIGITHFDNDGIVDGGHEITVVDYALDQNGKGFFICNDTDDGINKRVPIQEEKLLPIIHHAGISPEALGEDIVVEQWREILDAFQESLLNNNNNK